MLSNDNRKFGCKNIHGVFTKIDFFSWLNQVMLMTVQFIEVHFKLVEELEFLQRAKSSLLDLKFSLALSSHFISYLRSFKTQLERLSTLKAKLKSSIRVATIKAIVESLIKALIKATKFSIFSMSPPFITRRIKIYSAKLSLNRWFRVFSKSRDKCVYKSIKLKSLDRHINGSTHLQCRLIRVFFSLPQKIKLFSCKSTSQCFSWNVYLRSVSGKTGDVLVEASEASSVRIPRINGDVASHTPGHIWDSRKVWLRERNNNRTLGSDGDDIKNVFLRARESSLSYEI